MNSALKDHATYINNKVDTNEISISQYISTDNILQNKQGIECATSLPIQGGKVTAFKKGDILLANIRPYLKKIWYAQFDGGCSADVLAIRANAETDSHFLFYALFRDDFFIHAMKGAKGTKMPRGDKAQIMEFKIPVFDLKTQQSIAAVLSTLDKKITLNKQINARLEEMAKILYDYWFVQFDFPDANGKPYKFSGGEMVFDEILKREIPKGWEVKSLNQVADIVMGQSPDGASYNLEQEGTIFFQGSTDFDWRFPNVRQYTTSPTRFAQKGDILLSVRAPVGDLNISPFECCIGRGLAALRSKSGNNSFLFYVMKYFKTVFERRNTEGTTFGSITKDDLHSLKLVVPADNVLEKYNEIASKYDEMIFIRSQQNHQLTQLRDFLLPMLMNGQVSVAE